MTEVLKQGLFLLIVFIANVIQVLTGFAGTMLAMPSGIRLLGMDEAKVILNFLGLAASLGICVRNCKKIVWKELGRMIFGMVWGIAAGIFLFRTVSANILLTGYGVLLIAIALQKLFVPQGYGKKKWMDIPVLLLAGIIHGMFVSGGALLVVYAADAISEKNKFRATVSAVWVVLNTILLLEQVKQGSCSRQTILVSLFSLLPLAAAFVLGNRLHERIPQAAFLKLTYVLLLLSGFMVLF